MFIVVTLLFTLLHALRIFNSIAAKAVFDLHFPKAFIISEWRYNRAPPLTGSSMTQRRKILSVHSRNIDFICPAVVILQLILGR